MSTKADLITSLRTAHARGECPAAPGVDLRGVDLRGADLGGANFGGADLEGANLGGADLRGANFGGADLGGADLRGTDLRFATLRGATLGGADLRGADLWDADLRDVNLRGANMRGVDLRGANLALAWGVLSVQGLPSGLVILRPLTTGWHLDVGCWYGTTAGLRDLIARDTGWPDAKGEEVTARRPMLTALADMCDAWAAAHHHYLTAVQDRWGATKET